RRPVHRRLFRARLQARRRLDDRAARPGKAFRRCASGHPQCVQFLQAGGRREGAALVRRRPHAVPRIRPRPARPAVERHLSAARRHLGVERFRRAALTALRALAGGTGDPAEIRPPRAQRSADAESAARPSAGHAHLQPGLRHGGIHRLRAGRSRYSCFAGARCARREPIRARRPRAHLYAGRHRHAPPPAAFPASVFRRRLRGGLLLLHVVGGARCRRLRGVRGNRQRVRPGHRPAPARLDLQRRQPARSRRGLQSLPRPPAGGGCALEKARARQRGDRARQFIARRFGAALLLPRTISDALRDDVAFFRFDLVIDHLAAVLGQSVAIVRRGVDIGVRIIFGGADRDGAERAERDECPPAAVVTRAIAATPDRIVAAADRGAEGAVRRGAANLGGDHDAGIFPVRREDLVSGLWPAQSFLHLNIFLRADVLLHLNLLLHFDFLFHFELLLHLKFLLHSYILLPACRRADMALDDARRDPYWRLSLYGAFRRYFLVLIVRFVFRRELGGNGGAVAWCGGKRRK